MPHIRIQCTVCKTPHPDSMVTVRCEACRAPLDVFYPDSGGPALAHETGAPLPVHDPSALVRLGEGNTPCVSLDGLAHRIGLDLLWAKLEFANPTGSFKDRGTAVMMSMAREQGVAEIVEDSSGNAGASVSAYAARAQIRAHIFAPSSAPLAKLQQISVYGAALHSIPGPRENAAAAAVAYCDERGAVYASHNLSPFFIEGTKIFAYEVLQDLPEGIPAHVVMPVGNGSLFIGAYKGFAELIAAGRAATMPRFHSVQARAVMPLVAAFSGERWTLSEGARTVAGGISVGSPARLGQCLEVLRSTSGVALAVDDDAILRWQRLLAEEEGIYAEPTSAAAFAGLDELVRTGEIQKGQSVLVPVTGSGLKDVPPG